MAQEESEKLINAKNFRAQFKKDFEKLQESFLEFNGKYGALIGGYTITRYQESCWNLETCTMDGTYLDEHIKRFVGK